MVRPNAPTCSCDLLTFSAEAQYIKNKDTQASKGCHALHAHYRLCLSGTPMQNSCDEYGSRPPPRVTHDRLLPPN